MSCDIEPAAQSFNVTVYLAKPKSCADVDERLHGDVDVTKKRKRDQNALNYDAWEFPLDQINIDSHKLRQCSNYFDTCMSSQWTSSPPTVFHLAVHTDIGFYKDCFNRMRNFPSMHPISSVADCIQLLTVASQIEFSHFLETGVRYLTAVPWSQEDENQIRAFLDTGQLSSYSTTDLCQRLQSNTSENSLELPLRVLHRSLKLSSVILNYNADSTEHNRNAFKVAFEAIVCGSKGRQMAVTIVKEELNTLRISIQDECRQEGSFRSVNRMHAFFSQFAWLYGALRWTNSAQEVVGVLLADQDMSPLVLSKFQSLAKELHKNSEKFIRGAEKKWAGMMRMVFEDVLIGRLFLSTEERRALFRQWIWILKDENFHPRARIASLVSRFVMTFPLEEQEAIFDQWLTDVGVRQATCDLSKPHLVWLKQMIPKFSGDTGCNSGVESMWSAQVGTLGDQGDIH